MTESARMLAFASALLVAISFLMWANWLRGPLLQRLDGQRASNASPRALAVKFLIAAFVLSAVAAALAIVGWISP